MRDGALLESLRPRRRAHAAVVDAYLSLVACGDRPTDVAYVDADLLADLLADDLSWTAARAFGRSLDGEEARPSRCVAVHAGRDGRTVVIFDYDEGICCMYCASTVVTDGMTVSGENAWQEENLWTLWRNASRVLQDREPDGAPTHVWLVRWHQVHASLLPFPLPLLLLLAREIWSELRADRPTGTS